MGEKERAFRLPEHQKQENFRRMRQRFERATNRRQIKQRSERSSKIPNFVKIGAFLFATVIFATLISIYRHFSG